MDLTPNQLSTLRHMLGIDVPSMSAPKPHRNYAAVTPGDPDFVELERLGAIERYEARESSYHWYRCTEAGKAAAFASFKAIQLPKRKRIYLAFLEACDYAPDLTFHQFITQPMWAETRAKA